MNEMVHGGSEQGRILLFLSYACRGPILVPGPLLFKGALPFYRMQADWINRIWFPIGPFLLCIFESSYSLDSNGFYPPLIIKVGQSQGFFIEGSAGPTIIVGAPATTAGAQCSLPFFLFPYIIMGSAAWSHCLMALFIHTLAEAST